MKDTIRDVRKTFWELWHGNRDLTQADDRDLGSTVEILGAQFVADEKTIFGEVDDDYVNRELEWYVSQSLNVNDIPGKVPKIWKRVADESGRINSNYGWCVWSAANGNQYLNCLQQLMDDRDTRRACMIYQRPSMQWEYCRDGMSDFICTNSVNVFIRNGELHYLVYMRSNDAVFGYKNDKAWHDLVHGMMLKDLQDRGVVVKRGRMVWHSASLHVYARHFYLIQQWAQREV